MRVLVATDARLREAEDGVVQIFDFNICALGWRNLLDRMALLAGESRVFAFQLESRECMVETFRIPLDQREILAVVVGVAGGAALARSRLNVVGGVQSLVSGNARRNLGVALEAFEYTLAPESVARCAIRRAVHRLVCARQRPGRNLRVRRTVQAHRGYNCEKTGKKWMLRSHVVHEST